MRIFSAIRHSVNPKQYYSGLWTANFYPALRELGHEIVESQTDLFPTSRFMDVAGDFTPAELELRADTTERILDEVRQAHAHRPLDVFLSYFYNSHFDAVGFDELRRMGIPSVNFYCNSMYQFELVRAVAAKADFAWHAERDARQLYLDAGANPVWVQMAADPNLYRPIPNIRRLQKACFVGQRYCDRDRLIASLVRAGVPVEVYGAGWKNGAESNPSADSEMKLELDFLGRRKSSPGSWQSYFSVLRQNIARAGFCGGVLRSARQLKYRRDSRVLSPLIASVARGHAGDISSVLAAHEVCLNFSNVWSDGRPGSQLIPHVRLRDFEAPMSRTCYLTGHSDEITEFYDVGREIDTYSLPDELVDKTRFYLRHQTAAERLREAGYRRALRDHTWRSRFEKLFRKIGLSAVH
jgi:spore maturation protein CgeB